MNPFFINHPSSLSEIQGQYQATLSLDSFFKNFKKGQGLFLYGPPGTGKTSSVYAYAKQENYDLLELNASDARSKNVLQEFLSKACGQASLFGTKKIILLDEVDGLSGMKDRGASTAIAEYMKTSPFPIVVTGSDVFDKKFAPIKKAAQLIEFAALPAKDIVVILERVIAREHLDIDVDVLKAIARHANGDVRAALNDLFTLAIVSHSDVADVGIRKKTVEITQALIPVFKSTDPSLVFGSFDDVDEDLDKIFLWVDQNLPKEYTKSNDLFNAYEVLSLADRFFGRIRKWQYYRYYVYCYLLLSVGIALSKDKKYSSAPKYSQPSRLLKYWQKNMQYAKRKAIVEKLARATNISQKTALQDSLPLLLPVLAFNKEIQEELEITPDEVAWLKKLSASS